MSDLAVAASAPTAMAPGNVPGDLLVRAGQVTALRLFDVAYAVDLKRAETLWAARAARAGERRGLTGTPPKAMAFGEPPLTLRLPPVPLALPGGDAEAQVTARVYDFGVVSLALTLPVADLPWSAFTVRVNRLQQAVGPGAAAGDLWRGLLEAVRAPLREALERPTGRVLEEDYLLAVVNRLEEPLPAEALAECVDLVPLLSGETRPLSAGARAELLRQRFSYYADDLVVLTWDRAFVYEPRQETDVLDVLEVANAQLLEMRFYDELLDEELPRIYDLVEAARRAPTLLSARRYARLARRLHGLVAEVTELTERVDNALQVTEDVYLARVYAAAMALFRVPVVSAAVDRKLQTVRETYQALYDEASSSRAELLEIAILLLIALEIVLSLVRH
ncbi:hypothetical protein [Paracraurococcus lichenis]|uniref:DUF155 domain-containing protein n=1 Tax=Paracraurococcus lichenis TaxID=3064888 RepID=A0ABT9E324_9PROT|nr:hypothetical protein [Paracraurococcus sp. LOR1-02]MDO9710569.1 hypothetical protein [Paracraurococcus sp. LOR1-02]